MTTAPRTARPRAAGVTVASRSRRSAQARRARSRAAARSFAVGGVDGTDGRGRDRGHGQRLAVGVVRVQTSPAHDASWRWRHVIRTGRCGEADRGVVGPPHHRPTTRGHARDVRVLGACTGRFWTACSYRRTPGPALKPCAKTLRRTVADTAAMTIGANDRWLSPRRRGRSMASTIEASPRGPNQPTKATVAGARPVPSSARATGAIRTTVRASHGEQDDRADRTGRRSAPAHRT